MRKKVNVVLLVLLALAVLVILAGSIGRKGSGGDKPNNGFRQLINRGQHTE